MPDGGGDCEGRGESGTGAEVWGSMFRTVSPLVRDVGSIALLGLVCRPIINVMISYLILYLHV